MLYAITRRDRPGMAAERARLQPAHAEYQKPFLPRIVFGGGMVGDAIDTAADVDISDVIGNVLVMDVPDRAAAEAFHRDDPYTKAGLFETVIIERLWQRVPPPDAD
ncbi:MAG: YciI family protein [Alphaproteobacteria bacterium]|jgi:uncharacterized protein YciI